MAILKTESVDEARLLFEKRAVGELMAPIETVIREVVTMLSTADSKDLAKFRIAVLRQAIDKMEPLFTLRQVSLIEDIWYEGVRLGRQNAMDDMPPDARREALNRLPKKASVSSPAYDVDKEINAKVMESVRGVYAETMGSADIDTAISSVKAAETGSRRTFTWNVHRSHSIGVVAESKDAGASVIWVPERGACLHCLAYAGEVQAAGVEFPIGLSYDPSGGLSYPRSGTLIGPPLHPGCRCHIRTYFGGPAMRPSSSIPDAGLPDALKREARRTVALGRSEFASDPKAADAAARLLRYGADLPKSVETRSRGFIRRIERDKK